MVTSAGYGTLQQALRIGVPMVLSGLAQDKPEIGPLSEWAKVGIYKPFAYVPAEELRDAVDKILTTPMYKETVMMFKDRYNEYEPLGRIDRLIEESLAKIESI